MMDAIKKPKLKPKANNPMNRGLQSKGEDTAQRNKQTNPNPYTPEMKVWISVVLSSLIIVGVWIATFSIPHSNRSEPPSTSELKDILLELRNSMKSGVEVVKEQQQTLTKLTKPDQQIEPTLSNEELNELAHQLTANIQASTTTTTIPTLKQQPRTEPTPPKLP